MENFRFNLHNQDCLEVLKTMPDGSLDIICIDPPYLYLKGQKLERPFDEQLFFSECYRVLKNGGFIVMFGRGTSFYRWNYLLSEKGFEFKEEIIWNKSQCSSPLMALSRVHETISLHCKGKGKINKVKVPYLEMKGHDLDGVVQDIKRLKSVLKNTKSLDAVIAYLENNDSGFKENHVVKHQVQVNGHTKDRDRGINVIQAFDRGMNEKTIIRADFERPNKERKHAVSCEATKPTGDRACNVMHSMYVGMNEKSIIQYDGKAKENNHNSAIQPCTLKSEDRSAAVVRIIDEGMNEKSIIKQVRDHYSSIHPTQKPVRLLERIMKLCLPPSATVIKVADFFAGSCSTGEACFNLANELQVEIEFIGCEIDSKYFEGGKNRLESLK